MQWFLLFLIGCGMSDTVRTERFVEGVCVGEDGELFVSVRGGSATAGCQELLSWSCEAEWVDDQLLLDAEVVI